MPDSVQIHCTRCRATFRDRANRVQPGNSRQCPSCEVVIFFEEGSNDRNVRTAMQTARDVRRVMREAEGVKKATKAAATVYDRNS